MEGGCTVAQTVGGSRRRTSVGEVAGLLACERGLGWVVVQVHGVLQRGVSAAPEADACGTVHACSGTIPT